MSALLDTGFLLAVLDADDDLHESCVTALSSEKRPCMPAVVLPELAYMVLRELGYPRLIAFLTSLLNGELEIVESSMHDLERATQLLEKYADNRIDFVDCMIAAMAERLNIRRILTVDRRHFQLFRPTHCAYFDIAP